QRRQPADGVEGHQPAVVQQQLAGALAGGAHHAFVNDAGEFHAAATSVLLNVPRLSHRSSILSPTFASGRPAPQPSISASPAASVMNSPTAARSACASRTMLAKWTVCLSSPLMRTS